ncbi:hypothetical protein [Deinococcus sp.]|uniref:hypothetical protein n=1 Tax=Deinococcus sp. TaxID=47478 RepID=UPI0028698B12|nr:hypothetical protein [Deinococcus sp.]
MLQSNTIRRSALAVLAATLSVSMMACKQTTAPGAATVTGVTLAANPTAIAIGSTSNVTANVTGTNSPTNKVTFSVTSGATFVTLASTSNNTASVTGVAAGTATIQACSTLAGYTTKCGTTTVTVNAAGGGGTLTTAHINFAKTAGDVMVRGVTYAANTGAAYDGTSGWVTEASLGSALVPLNMTGNGRDRTTTNTTNTTDVTQTTQINMQCNTQTSGNPCSSGTLTSGAFEYAVANGTYSVTVSVGDAAGDPSKSSTFQDNQNSVHVINVEGTNVVPAFTQTGTTNGSYFSFKKATVTVTDGMLTVDAIGGKNTKINYIDITPAP